MNTGMATPAQPLVSAGENSTLLDRADLMYCLARAFLPPPEGWSTGAVHCNDTLPQAELWIDAARFVTAKGGILSGVI